MLKIVKEKSPKKTGEQIVHDANDLLSSFPDAKTEQRSPTPKEKKIRRVPIRREIINQIKTKTKTRFMLNIPKGNASAIK